MKAFFILLAVCLVGAAAWFATLAKSSYSSYSADQLVVLEQGISALKTPTEEQAYSGVLLEEEKRRRILFPLLAGAAVLAAVGAWVARGRERFLGASPEEEARFAASMGNPALVLEGARNKAAALLGVAVGAPPAVIEAALRAQLESRDPARMAGLAADLKALALEQREDLVKARDLLLKNAR